MKQLWQSKINNLYNVSSDTNKWNVWKWCNDTVEDKSPAIKNRKHVETVFIYQNLFTKDYDLSVKTPETGEK